MPFGQHAPGLCIPCVSLAPEHLDPKAATRQATSPMMTKPCLSGGSQSPWSPAVGAHRQTGRRQLGTVANPGTPPERPLHHEGGRVGSEEEDQSVYLPRGGNCMSLKECYPYFKIPSLDTADTWVMGLYDTCSYMGPTGRSVSAGRALQPIISCVPSSSKLLPIKNGFCYHSCLSVA